MAPSEVATPELLGPGAVEEVAVPWRLNQFSSRKDEKDKPIEREGLLVYKESGDFKKLAEDKPERSVMKLRASAYLFCCCFYNCCCCCLPKRWVGPVCGKKFCCPYGNDCQIRMRRDRWLGLVHFVCFVIHATMAYLSLDAGYGKPMELAIYRVKPEWNNTGRNGYNYEVVRDFDLRIDEVTAAFFMLSAIFHFIWVVPSVTSPVLWSYMTAFIDDCFCPW